MFGTVLAMLNTSACRPAPSAAASRMPRTKPLSRDTIVPAAITALEESRASSGSTAASGRFTGGGRVVAHSSSTRQRLSRIRSTMRRTIITARSTPPAMMMYQISRPTWLVRRLKVSGVPGVLALGRDRGERHLVHADPAADLQPQGGALPRPACSPASGVSTFTLGLSARARSPTVIGCSRPLTSVTVSDPEPPESVTKSVPVTWTRSISARVRGVEGEHLVGGERRAWAGRCTTRPAARPR